jgi:hypothetical protein
MKMMGSNLGACSKVKIYAFKTKKNSLDKLLGPG